MTVHREHKVKRENQQYANNSIFVIKLLSQHVSGTIMPIIRRIRPCAVACGVLPGCVGCGLVEVRREPCALCENYCSNSNFHTVHTAHDTAPQNYGQPQPTHPGRTPHAVVHGLILLMMGIMMPETC